MAAMERMITCSEKVETWAEEGEAWVEISPVPPSPASPRLCQEGWWKVSS